MAISAHTGWRQIAMDTGLTAIDAADEQQFMHFLLENNKQTIP
jgi:hypothetical protein